ncbi:hypothetical protein LTR95_018782 [Oleoguttula sp. CCFEE 5521]
MQLLAQGSRALDERASSPLLLTSTSDASGHAQSDADTSATQSALALPVAARRTQAVTLYNSARPSDITAVIGGEEVKAHRVKLEECPFFECMLSRTGHDATVVDLDTSEASPIVVKGLLYFLYHNRYDVEQIDGMPSPEWDAISLHAEVYVLASKYAMAGLAQVAAHHVLSWTGPRNDLTELFDTLHVLWTSKFEDCHGLRQHFAAYCLSVIRTLAQEPWFQELMRKTELGADIAIALATGGRSEQRVFSRCSCNWLFDRRGKIQCKRCRRANDDKGNKKGRNVLPMETWMRV